MEHFLEVFNPAFAIDTGDVDIGTYINDSIVRCLAGLERLDRPLFLKIQYNGARAMAELAEFDPTNLVVGILGGSAGTTRDTFELIEQASEFGARVALFGRKIYKAEGLRRNSKLNATYRRSRFVGKGTVKHITINI